MIPAGDCETLMPVCETTVLNSRIILIAVPVFAVLIVSAHMLRVSHRPSSLYNKG
jgi:hypothetical protein